MAIYRLSASVISRSSGRSAVAAAAYRSGEKLLNERDGVSHDYSHRSGVEAAEIIAPDNAPEWARDRYALWNGVEQCEKRKDAQTAREVVLSLPHELDGQARHDLVTGFVQEQFVARGMVADIAVHAPHREGDDRNHHAHVMLTTRVIGRDGFGKKERAWNDKALLQDWREQWANHVNRSLEQANIAERVDHRSLKVQREEALEMAAQETTSEHRAEWEAKAQEVDREPEPKLGAAAAMERRGIRTAVGDLVRDARALREAAKKLADKVLERSREAALELRSRLGEQLRQMGLRGLQEERQNLERALRESVMKGLAEEKRQRQLEEEKRLQLEKQKGLYRSQGRDRGGMEL